MKRTLAAFAVAVAVAGGLTGCTFRSNASPASTTTATVSIDATAVTTSAVVEPVDAGGLFAHGASATGQPPTTAVAPAPVPTILLPVPPLPADMQQVRPSTPPSAIEPDEHDHDHTAGDVAAEWIAALYTGRYDDPPNAAADALRPLAASQAMVDAALATVGPVDVDGGEARWPYIAEVTDAGDGWWQATVLLKSTRFGQVGPSSTPLTVRVHVSSVLLADDWEQTS